MPLKIEHVQEKFARTKNTLSDCSLLKFTDDSVETKTANMCKQFCIIIITIYLKSALISCSGS